MKKLLLGLGQAAAIAAPTAKIVSIGSKKKNEEKEVWANAIKVEDFAQTGQSIFISKEIYKRLKKGRPNELPVRSYDHRKWPAAWEMGVSTYLPTESWGYIIDTLGIKPMFKKLDSGIKVYFFQDSALARDILKEHGFEKEK